MIIITIINTDVWLYPQPPIHLKKKKNLCSFIHILAKDSKTAPFFKLQNDNNKKYQS